MSLANISIVGNLAREPEQKQFTSGRVKTTLVVAVNGFNAVRKEKTTDFYRVEIWDRLGELARNYLKKGNQVAVSGKLGYEKWTDREGKDRITPCVQANQLALPPRLKPYPDPPPAAAAKAVPLEKPPEDPDVILDGHTDVDSENTSEKSDSDEIQENASMHFDDQSDGSLACDESDTTSDTEQSVEQVEESEEDLELAKTA